MSILPEDHEPDAVFVERYCQHGDPVRACVEAGITDPRFPISVVAQRILARPEIKAAIAAIEKIGAQQQARVEITRDSILADMQSIYEKAMACGEFNSAIAAKKLQAAIMRLLDANITVNHRLIAGDLSDDDLERIASQKLRDSAIDAEYTETPRLPAPRKGIGGFDA